VTTRVVPLRAGSFCGKESRVGGVVEQFVKYRPNHTSNSRPSNTRRGFGVSDRSSPPSAMPGAAHCLP